MVFINGFLSLKETENEISKKILQTLLPQVNNYLNTALSKCSDQIKNLVLEAIKSAPEYQSLISGQLKAEFGLPDSENRINSILNFWENINVQYQEVKIKKNTLVGGFTINMIKKDFSDVINSSAAIFTTEKGSNLNWLEWLLLFGNQTIIKDYTVQLGPNPRSRTGMAVMKGVISGKWSVPSSYSGTINDNWVTRSIDSIDTQIENLLSKSLRK